MRNIEKYKDNIEKHINECGLYQILISLVDGENLCQLPRFPLSSEMYKGMDSKKWYSLQELGL